MRADMRRWPGPKLPAEDGRPPTISTAKRSRSILSDPEISDGYSQRLGDTGRLKDALRPGNNYGVRNRVRAYFQF